MSLQDTLFDVFRSTAQAHPDNTFLAVPSRHTATWDTPANISYASALEQVEAFAAAYKRQGFGVGDHVALAFDSRPQYFYHYLALNAIGACAVPLNTDLTAPEIVYQIAHADCCAIVGLSEFSALLSQAVLDSGRAVPFAINTPDALPFAPVWRRAHADEGQRVAPQDRAAAILFTSGTTGKPKGCVLSNLYVQESGRYYSELHGDVSVAPGTERILNPLPLYHMNSMVTTAGAAIIRAACLVLPGRFSITHWWSDLADTRTTRFHYLGIMIPALLTLPESPLDRAHGIRHAFGAGVDPAVHARFEERFGIALMEVWGMTETGRFLIVDREPRYIDTRACGRPLPGLQAQVVDEHGTPVPDGTPGELVVRHSAAQPRYGFFSGYFKDPEATEAAWAGGWFHSGDICTRSADGMFYFVDRRKNIVRRSGENISSAEVEAALAESILVAQSAVLAAPDAMRDEEVLACVVLRPDVKANADTAAALFEFLQSRLAYFKIPGWLYFVTTLPTTGTQKIQKHRIFRDGFREDLPGLFDLRARKRPPRKQ